jgi:GT2 family glycosyltransferase
MPLSERPLIYIILPVHDRRATTERFARYLVKQAYRDWHLVLIDDGSQDGTADAVRSIIPDVTVLRGPGYWWWGGSLQHGFLWLKQQRPHPKDIVLLINDDTQIEPNFLSNATRKLEPRSLLLAQQYTLSARKLVEVGVNFDWARFTHATTLNAEEINCHPTRGLFMYAKDLIELGGFYPKLLPHYLSDYEFTMRARRKGYALTTDPSVRLFYDERKTGVRSFQDLNFLQRLQLAFSKRYMLNPIYQSNLVLLACPRRLVLLNLARVWKGFFVDLIRRREDSRPDFKEENVAFADDISSVNALPRRLQRPI